MRQKIATVDELKPGQRKVVELDGKNVVVFNVNGQLFALEDSCSHMGAPVSTGMLAKNSITCEWHGATFDLTTGEALCAPAKLPIKTYPVFVNGQDIEVEY